MFYTAMTRAHSRDGVHLINADKLEIQSNKYTASVYKTRKIEFDKYMARRMKENVKENHWMDVRSQQLMKLFENTKDKMPQKLRHIYEAYKLEPERYL